MRSCWRRPSASVCSSRPRSPTRATRSCDCRKSSLGARRPAAPDASVVIAQLETDRNELRRELAASEQARAGDLGEPRAGCATRTFGCGARAARTAPADSQTGGPDDELGDDFIVITDGSRVLADRVTAWARALGIR